MGFCRTNLFKRLESGGPAFIQSIQRHVIRNLVFLHAIENELPIPIGSQGAELLDISDEDADSQASTSLFEDAEHEVDEHDYLLPNLEMDRLRTHAESVYEEFSAKKAEGSNGLILNFFLLTC